jgi:hypothetical protein
MPALLQSYSEAAGKASIHRLQPEFGRVRGGAVNTYIVGFASPGNQWVDPEARVAVQVPAPGTSKTLRVKVCRYTSAVADCK